MAPPADLRTHQPAAAGRRRASSASRTDREAEPAVERAGSPRSPSRGTPAGRPRSAAASIGAMTARPSPVPCRAGWVASTPRYQCGAGRPRAPPGLVVGRPGGPISRSVKPLCEPRPSALAGGRQVEPARRVPHRDRESPAVGDPDLAGGQPQVQQQPEERRRAGRVPVVARPDPAEQRVDGEGSDARWRGPGPARSGRQRWTSATRRSCTRIGWRTRRGGVRCGRSGKGVAESPSVAVQLDRYRPVPG